jgi:hypothetical protein
MIPGRRVRIMVSGGLRGIVTGQHVDGNGTVWVMVRHSQHGGRAVGYLPWELELELDLELDAAA